MAYSFNDQETIGALQDNLNLIIKEDNAPEAYLFAKNLQELLDTPKLADSLENKTFRKYERMVMKAKFLSLYKQDEEEIFNLINNHLKMVVNIKFYNLLNKIDDFLSINKYILVDRDKFKDELRRLLSENKNNITEKDININKKEFSPSIANWLKDFRNEFAENGFLERVNLVNYLSRNENFTNLSDKEKKVVKVLIDLYAHLKVFSSSSEGVEEHISVETEDGEKGIMINGNIEKIPQAVIDIFNEVQRKTGGELYNSHKKEKKVSSEKVFVPEEDKGETIHESSQQGDNKKSVEKLLESYKSFEIDLKGISGSIKSLEEYQNNPDGLFKKFDKDLQEGNRDSLLALVIFICQNKLLDKFLKENKDLLAEFKKYLSFKLSDDIIKSIMNKSASPETVSLYLQFLLFKKIKLSSKNAGLFGMHLANILKKNGQDKYFPIVYGDVNLEQFVWREVIEENGLVKFK
jgi:hypothetical protein